ncbi:M20/M25/M40 family metallo-hydrolase [Paraglaciecola chathamensis]|uniref:M20/M25/M40 family metallo-hydrolase n=1 Tax=Paraglaciecola chathamensis TaxID=368405 RepID=A0ABS0WGK1_9ALTE|nr:M20/M25/M40 family metallo-hydrolase [Paraglaciecola chathamensis]MBJ2137620.1 M20/M25/M40 family metallo-hydrolase [Paraglaciecola chathamensis]
MKKNIIYYFTLLVFFSYHHNAIAQSQAQVQNKALVLNKATQKQLKEYESFFKENHKRHINDLVELIAIPTMSMKPENKPELKKAANLLKGMLDTIGMENAEVHFTNELPVVTASYTQNKSQPTILFYGHFDVQPVAKERWKSDPFSAEIRDERLYGRGATDDKGPIIALISAIEGLIKVDGKLPVNIKLLLDGGEEMGSPHLPIWLASNQEWLNDIDYGINVDAMMKDDNQGLMWKGLRGAADLEVTITSANTDLHSGIYGGVAPNAALAASKVIASLWNDDGSIAIKGFYNGLKQYSEKEREEIAAVVDPNQETEDLKKFGIEQWIGEKEYSFYERPWIRTSVDITGFKAGYIQGKASIIPHTAWFRMLARTGPDHDPKEVLEMLKKHVKDSLPWGLKVGFKESVMGTAPVFDENDLGFRIGKQVLTDFFGTPPIIVYIGGSVPALSSVPDGGGPNLVSIGFQRSDENFHADNEYMRIDSFKKGQRIYMDLLHAFVDQLNE